MEMVDSFQDAFSKPSAGDSSHRKPQVGIVEFAVGGLIEIALDVPYDSRHHTAQVILAHHGREKTEQGGNNHPAPPFTLLHLHRILPSLCLSGEAVASPRRSVRQSATAAFGTSGTPKATKYIEPLITSLMPNASEGWSRNSHRRSSPPSAGAKNTSRV